MKVSSFPFLETVKQRKAKRQEGMSSLLSSGFPSTNDLTCIIISSSLLNCCWFRVYTVKNLPVGTGLNMQSDGKRLIFRQTDSLALRLLFCLIEFLMKSIIFYCVIVHHMLYRAYISKRLRSPGIDSAILRSLAGQCGK
jgi:hypothetical protein